MVFVGVFPPWVEVKHEFMKDRAPAYPIDQVIDVLFGKRPVFAKQRPGDALPIYAPPMGDVAKVRFDPVFAPDVFGFHDCHSR
jgi:hypothetical protein